ncbi:MAG: S1 RNA-binding domain-containing protein, partial [Desulfobacterales bacterium]
QEKIDVNRYITNRIGIPTLNDIRAELARPGRDPRKDFEVFAFAQGIQEIAELKPGMKVPGIVSNVTAFGAFVDIGVHQDGLVHISELSDQYVKNPADVVKVNQKVEVTVIGVDLERNRISLSMKTAPGKPAQTRPAKTRVKKKEKQLKTKNAPFNNPFAELLGRSLT